MSSLLHTISGFVLLHLLLINDGLCDAPGLSLPRVGVTRQAADSPALASSAPGWAQWYRHVDHPRPSPSLAAGQLGGVIHVRRSTFVLVVTRP
ncbi:hypothetical protein ACEVHA_028095 [Klebsiella pneumoniae]